MSLFIGTGSATYASKSGKILDSMGIKNRIVRRTVSEDMGCGWGVEINESDKTRVMDILANSGIKINLLKQ
ncbi:MAG: hypothetical protein IJO74_04585 [Clostridia bacterium]|nr:hypothetical protein [Clostridia bacterium]